MLLYAGANVRRDDAARRRTRRCILAGQDRQRAAWSDAAAQAGADANAPHHHRHDAADAGRRRRATPRRSTRCSTHGADVNAKEPAASETALMFAAALRPRRRRARAARRTAPTSKATSKVVDLTGARRSPSASACSQASRDAPRRAGDRGERRGAGAAARPRRRRRGRRSPASIAAVSATTSWSAAQGGLTPLLLRRAPGQRSTRCRRCVDAGADVNQRERRRPHQPAAHRDHQRPLRPRDAICSTRAPIRTWRSDNGVDAALRGAQRRVGAARRSTRSRARYVQQQTHLPRSDDGAARQGRRSRTRGSTRKVWYSRLQLRPARASTRPAPRRSGAPPTPATSTR